MNSGKQSNWILGLGILVAIIVIISSLWLYQSPGNIEGDLHTKRAPEVGQTIIQVNKGLGWLSSVIKSLN